MLDIESFFKENFGETLAKQFIAYEGKVKNTQ